MSTLNIRRTATDPARAEMDLLGQVMVSIAMLVSYSTLDAPGLADGTTAGKIKTGATVTYHIGRGVTTKAATDDLWDLSGEVATSATEYRAYWLLLNTAGAASIAAGTGATTEADALGALPELDGTKGVIGVYMAWPSTNFANALAAQGVIYNGIPDGSALPGDLRGTYTSALPVVAYK